MVTENSWWLIAVTLAIFVGGILLQIFLSKNKNRWLGLILPAITLGYSLVMVMSIAMYGGMSTVYLFATIAAIFLVSNVPTLILLGIYFACRQSLKRKAQLAKMDIQDLS